MELRCGYTFRRARRTASCGPDRGPRAAVKIDFHLQSQNPVSTERSGLFLERIEGFLDRARNGADWTEEGVRTPVVHPGRERHADHGISRIVGVPSPGITISNLRGALGTAGNTISLLRSDSPPGP